MLITSLNRYEQEMSSCPTASKEFCSILAGVSRVTRLSKSYPDKAVQVIWDTGANIIGPAFFFFTWWVLETAKRLKIQRLYFLSRDAHIFLKIAEMINDKGGYGIDCRYLYGSRHLWLTSSLEGIGEYELEWILSDWWFDLTVSSVFKRIGIKPEDIRQDLQAHGFEEALWHKKLTGAHKVKIRECLLNPLVQEKIVALLRPQFDQTVAYLKQEGLGDGENFGIVDIGWKAKPQAALNKILRRGNMLPAQGISGFYFGSTETNEICPGDETHSFLFDLSTSLQRCQLRNNHLYEAFASSDEGKIKAFINNEGRIVPLFDHTVSGPVIEWGVGIQQESMLTFAREFIKQYPLEKLRLSAIYPVIDKNLNMFLTKPSKDEAQVYGSFPMDGELTESKVQEIAPLVSRKEFWYLCCHLKEFDLYWVQASLIRSKLWLEFIIWKLLLPVLEYSYYMLMFFVTKIGKRR